MSRGRLLVLVCRMQHDLWTDNGSRVRGWVQFCTCVMGNTLRSSKGLVEFSSEPASRVIVSDNLFVYSSIRPGLLVLYPAWFNSSLWCRFPADKIRTAKEETEFRAGLRQMKERERSKLSSLAYY